MKHIPGLLVWSRLVLGPLMILETFFRTPTQLELGILLSYALLSDILDGQIARRWKVASPSLRAQDSFSDVVFWGSTFVVLARLKPLVFHAYEDIFFMLIFLECASFFTAWLRFRRGVATHATSAKIYGLILFYTIFCFLCLDGSTVFMALTLAASLVSNVEIILILLLIPEWQADISSVRVAWHQRRQKRNLPSN